MKSRINQRRKEGMLKAGWHRVFFTCVLLGVGAALAASQPKSRYRDPDTERKIDSLISLMTIEEKLGQLSQHTGNRDAETGKVALTAQQRELIEGGHTGSFLGGLGLEVSREIQNIAVNKSRLGIPVIFGHDIIHGYRTIFPIPLAEAGSFDPEAVELAARIAAREATAMGLHWTFAPMVDIARDPRWGRIAEGSGEDPYLGSVMASARVRGFQGKDYSDPTTLVACAKHFVAYGAAEAGRDYNVADISERTLREVYLPPFKAAVDEGVGTLMSAFNEIGGIPASAHRGTLTDILRTEWGFKGFVVSDWTSVLELLEHGIAATPAEAALKALTAGVEMEMVSDLYRKELPLLVRNGTLPENVLNEAVRRVLRVKFAVGLFEDRFRNDDEQRHKKEILLPDHVASARAIAGRSIVLLKNQSDLLPLKKDVKTIAVIGPLADSRHEPLGPWHAEGRSQDVVSLLEGIRKAVSSKTKVLFSRGCDSTFVGTSGFAEALRVAGQADVVVLVVGERLEMSGEAASRSDIGLPGVQLDLVKQIHAVGKPVVLVLMNGRPLTIPWEAEHVPAILETWFLGIQSGNAIADVLFGDVNPAARLPVSFPRNVGQIPIHYDHRNTGRPPGDSKYTSKYLDVPNSPLFPFGHGLSYTTFEYENLKVTGTKIKRGEPIEVSVTVKNTGRRDGDEVVQLYIRDVVGSVTRPVKQLKGFERVFIPAGMSKTVKFKLTGDALSFYDINMKNTIEPGMFKVFVGGSSVDGLATEFEVVN
ncbi:MAG: glycoside hydrolase family 3 N-terminal domain-containing protein [Bacteroidota bacterium]